MSNLPVRVFVEKEQAVPFVQALLRPYSVEIRATWTMSSVISSAEVSLLDSPERPVVALLNAGTEDEREAAVTRLSAKRILARAYPENWCVAVVVPRLDAWARTDPRLRGELDTLLAAKAPYIERISRMGELVKDQPFDSSELYRRNADFGGLIEFLKKHAPAADAADRAASA